MSLFSVDGVNYDVTVVISNGLTREADITDGENAGRVKSGRMKRDIIGTYFNYTMKLDAKRLSPADYDRLYDVLTAPNDSHMIVVPFGQSTLAYEAYVSKVTDTLKDRIGGVNHWGDLTVTFTAMEPQRRPG